MNARTIDMTGQRIGKLVVIRVSDRKGKGTFWECRCDCGTVKVMNGHVLRRGEATGCGCNRVRSHLIHGEARTDKHSREYITWCNVKQRCTDPDHNRYYRYGGRGIRMCDRWLHSFQAFLEDMGRRPSSKHSIDRINNDGDYEPHNCRWATSMEQRHNRGDSVAS